MKLLLDTHTLLWALGSPEKLPEYIVEMICNDSNDVYLSAASLWEISIKHKKNPAKMPFSASQIRDYCQRAGYYFLSVHAKRKFEISHFLLILFGLNLNLYDSLNNHK